MNSEITKSIDFLLERAGPVIRRRLRRDILGDLTPDEDARLLEEIYALPYYRELLTYVKPDGYIGSGMHSWDNWRGQVLHETPLQDGECAARLLSYYGIPKDSDIVSRFVAALRDEEVLKAEFSYIPPEITRYENRFEGLNSGNCLAALIYTMQALLGYGDDYDDLRGFQSISLEGFRRVKGLSSLDDILKYSNTKKPVAYIDSDEYYPNVYTLEYLAYTNGWRNDENIALLADALNRINEIMKPDNSLSIKVKGKYYAPGMALIFPIRALRVDLVDTIMYRRLLTEIAMLGVGDRAGVIRESADNVREALAADGILRFDTRNLKNKRNTPRYIEYPGAYCDVRLEADYTDKTAIDCDLTYWAVEFLHYVNNSFICSK